MSRDTSLSVLFPAVPVLVGGERLSLRPLAVGELPVAERILEAWRVMVATSGRVMDPEAWEDLLDLLAASVNRSRAWLDALAGPDLERLLCLVLAINEDVWNPKQEQTGEASMSWTSIFQQLISHGHSSSAINGYSLAQANAFLTACLKEEREALARDIQSAAFSMADGKAVEKAVKEIRRG